MNMIKLVTGVFMIILIISCGKENSEEIEQEFEVFKDGSSTEEIYDYGLSDSDIEFEYPFRKLNSDSSLICFVGIKESRIHVECFNTDTKNNLFSWSEPEQAETDLTIDLGYGEINNYKIDNYGIEQFLIKDGSFIIILNDLQGVKLLRSNIYFITDNNYKKESTIALSNEKSSLIYFNRMIDWYDNSIMVLPTDAYTDPNRVWHKNFCYNILGDLIYESETWSRQILENYYYPINYYDFIQIGSEIHSPSELSFVRMNSEKGNEIWSSKISDFYTPSDLRIDSVNMVPVDAEFILYNFYCTQKDGKAFQKKYRLNIETGQYNQE